MPLLNNYVFDNILVPVVFLFLLVSAIFALAFGIGLVVFQSRLLRLLGPMSRWVSLRKTLAPIEVQRVIEPFVHKYRRWFGALFILGGIFSILVLAIKVDSTAVTSAFGYRHLSPIGPWLVQSVTTFLIIGSLFAIAMGIILGFFPRVLAALEARTNHWYSSRRMVRGADTMYLPLDRWFEASPRTAGALLTVAAVILCIGSAIALHGHL